MRETIDTIKLWHQKTFRDETLEGQKEKFLEELREFSWANKDEELSELADMVIVSAGIARFVDYWSFLETTYHLAAKAGYDMTELWEAVQNKMQINRKRVWSKTSEGAYHHTNEE